MGSISTLTLALEAEVEGPRVIKVTVEGRQHHTLVWEKSFKLSKIRTRTTNGQSRLLWQRGNLQFDEISNRLADDIREQRRRKEEERHDDEQRRK